MEAIFIRSQIGSSDNKTSVTNNNKYQSDYEAHDEIAPRNKCNKVN